MVLKILFVVYVKKVILLRNRELIMNVQQKIYGKKRVFLVLLILCFSSSSYGMLASLKKCITGPIDPEFKKQQEFERSRIFLRRRHHASEPDLHSNNQDYILTRYREYYDGAERTIAEQKQMYDQQNKLLLSVLLTLKHELLCREKSQRSSIEFRQEARRLKREWVKSSYNLVIKEMSRAMNGIVFLQDIIDAQEIARGKIEQQEKDAFSSIKIEHDIESEGFVLVQ